MGLEAFGSGSWACLDLECGVVCCGLERELERRDCKTKSPTIYLNAIRALACTISPLDKRAKARSGAVRRQLLEYNRLWIVESRASIVDSRVLIKDSRVSSFDFWSSIVVLKVCIVVSGDLMAESFSLFSDSAVLIVDSRVKIVVCCASSLLVNSRVFSAWWWNEISVDSRSRRCCRAICGIESPPCRSKTLLVQHCSQRNRCEADRYSCVSCSVSLWRYRVG